MRANAGRFQRSVLGGVASVCEKTFGGARSTVVDGIAVRARPSDQLQCPPVELRLGGRAAMGRRRGVPSSRGVRRSASARNFLRVVEMVDEVACKSLAAK